MQTIDPFFKIAIIYDNGFRKSNYQTGVILELRPKQGRRWLFILSDNVNKGQRNKKYI